MQQISVSTEALCSLGIKEKEKVNENLDAWKWALIGKRKFEAVLMVLQYENSRLKDLLALMSTQPSARLPHQGLQQHPDAVFDSNSHRLGLATHAQLKKTVMSESPSLEVAMIFVELRPVSSQSSGTLTVCLFDKSKHDVVLVGLAAIFCRHRRSSNTSISRAFRRATTFASYICVRLSDRDIYIRCATLSLFEVINSNKVDVRFALPNRFQVAATLAKALAAFHSDGWVHKSLRSNSVIFLRDALSKNLMVKNPYVINFEYSRPQASQTKLDFDDGPERNLYRHPDRQGEPRTSFTRLHDIYALGVVLLEIGLWQTASSMVKDVKVPSGRQKSVQKVLNQLAEGRLAHHMGEKYTEAVLSCVDDRFERRIRVVDFSMIFHDEVVQKINVRALLDTHAC